MIRRWIPAILSILALHCGCSRNVEWLDARDRGEILIKRARAKRNEGDIDGAIALYREALRTEQRMALANLDLALLLHDEKKDYLGAVCHYARYLEARPDTDKREMIQKRKQLALQSFAATLAPEIRPSGAAGIADSGGEDRKENTELAVALQRLKNEQETAKSAVARAGELADRNNELQSVIRRLESELDQLRTVTVAASGSAPPSEPSPSEQRARKRTYEVMSGDSLSSIAAAVYGDGSKWHAIFERNRDSLGDSQKLKVGQVLVIP